MARRGCLEDSCEGRRGESRDRARDHTRTSGHGSSRTRAVQKQTARGRRTFCGRCLREHRCRAQQSRPQGRLTAAQQPHHPPQRAQSRQTQPPRSPPRPGHIEKTHSTAKVGPTRTPASLARAPEARPSRLRPRHAGGARRRRCHQRPVTHSREATAHRAAEPARLLLASQSTSRPRSCNRFRR